MEQKIVFIKQNSPEILEKLKQKGFTICNCVNFEDSIWLIYHPNHRFHRDIHGEGSADYLNDGYSPLERIEMRLKKDGYYSKEREFFDTVEEFLEVYNKNDFKL